MIGFIQRRRLFNILFSAFVVFSITVSTDSHAQEGSVDPVTGLITPLDITNALPYRGSALAGGKSYYVVKGLTPSAKYTIKVHSLTQNISLYGYSSPLFYYSVCSSSRSGLSFEACGLPANSAGEIYIKIDAYSAAADAAYTIEILPPPVNEGSKTAPLEVGGMLPYAGTVEAQGNSYYVISGLTAGQRYTINLTGIIHYPALQAYPHKDFINPGYTSLCWSHNDGWADESCELTANFEGKLYVHVSDSSYYAPGSFYTLDVTPAAGTERYFEGYLDAPILLNNQIYRGQSYLYPSHYRYSGLVPGMRYEVHVKNYTTSTYMNVFKDYTDTVGSSCGASSYYNVNNDMWCVASANALGELNFTVSGYDNEGGTSYELELADAPVAEGSELAPKSINMPYDGQVDNTRSYYVIPNLKPNWVYEVITTQATRNMYVNAGSDISNLEHSSTGRTNAAGELFFKVSTGSPDGVWFSVDLGDANNPEGSVSSPVDISSSSEISPHGGQVDNTTSYYVTKGLVPDAYYMVHMNGVNTVRPTLEVYADQSYTSRLCSDDFINTTEEGHCLARANSNGELYMLLKNESYRIEGTQYNLWLSPSLLNTQGTELQPIEIDSNGVVDAGGSISYQGMVSADYRRNVSYYRVRLNSGPAHYQVSLTGMTDNVDLEVTNHLSSDSQTDYCFSKHANHVEERCVIQSQLVKGKVKSVDLVIKVSTPTQNYTRWDGAAFTLMVEPVADADVKFVEGSWAEPKDITGALPYQGHVDHYRSSYYKIAGLNPGERYEVRVNSSRDTMSMRVFDNNNTNWSLCDVRFSTVPVPPRNIACQAPASSLGELYLVVKDNDSVYGATEVPFEVDIKPIPQGEGLAYDPLDISGQLPRASQVGGLLDAEGYYTQGEVNSYYKVGGLLPNTEYQVLITNTSRGLSYKSLQVYQDIDMSVASCDEGSFLLCRSVSNHSGELYIHVDGYSSHDQSGSYFDLNVRRMPKSEGSIDEPVVIGTGHYQGQHGGTPSASYYKLTGLPANRSQKIAVQNFSVTTEITLYGSADYKYELCKVDTGFGPTGCSAAVNSSGELFMKVKSDEAYKNGEDADTFDLYIP